MSDSSVKDTVAYRIIRQIIDHIYGSDENFSVKDFLNIFHKYEEKKGLWQNLVNGDMKSVKLIEDLLKEFMDDRKVQKVALIVENKFR